MSLISLLAAEAPVKAPTIEWAQFSPLLALFASSIVVLLAGLSRSIGVRRAVVPVLTVAGFISSVALAVWRWNETTSRLDASIFSGALSIDHLTVLALIGICVAGIAATVISISSEAAEETLQGEYYALLLVSAAGMVTLVAARDLVTFFVGLELASVPLYILAATNLRKRRSLEAGMKYLVVGSLASAITLYGLALIYGAAGATDYGSIAAQFKALNGNQLFQAGLVLTLVGIAFKSSLAPFHIWSPDVYQGTPSPVVAFMATATKVAALLALGRFVLIDGPAAGESELWRPLLVAFAAVSMIVGNVGALGQTSFKRMMAFSSVAQAGYITVGILLASRLGLQASTFYLLSYVLMVVAAFAVLVAVERRSGSEQIESFRGLGSANPLLGGAVSVALLALAGVPATVGFVAKIQIIQVAVDDYMWLAILLVIGSIISFVYYLRVLAAVWTPNAEQLDFAAQGSSSDSSAASGWHPGAVAVAVVAAAAIIYLGIFPNQLLDQVDSVDAGLFVP